MKSSWPSKTGGLSQRLQSAVGISRKNSDGPKSRVASLLASGLEARDLVVVGNYTSPRSWGVYKIVSSNASAGQSYRFGNHPVRQYELEREFGSVEIVRLFPARELAQKLSRLLNHGAE